MAKTPKSVRIRNFQVGFGDCFLLRFEYAGGDVRNVLIDFGTTAIPKLLETTAQLHMRRVAAKIAEDCGAKDGKKGKLHAVVATHRHADHISGFSTEKSAADKKKGVLSSGEIIARLEPDLVVQPWTEDPKAARNATSATATFQKGLAAMHSVAEAAVAFVGAEEAKGASASMSAKSLARLRFVGEDNVKSLSAVKNLIAMGHRPGSTAAYVNYGLKDVFKDVLPGVDVTVLGPPSLKQTRGIETMRSRDKIEFWQLLSGPASRRSALPLARGVGGASSRGARAISKPLALPPQARWFARRLTALRGAQILEIVTALDEQMNNTSVILLFEFGGKKLLFPGDAQLENWRYALKEVGDGVEAAKNVQRLADIDLYKVGHHGSLNATPKVMLWGHLTRRKKPEKDRLTTMMSTLPGKHPGKAGGEVPRKPLVDALRAETTLFATNDLKKSNDPSKVGWFTEVVVNAH